LCVRVYCLLSKRHKSKEEEQRQAGNFIYFSMPGAGASSDGTFAYARGPQDTAANVSQVRYVQLADMPSSIASWQSSIPVQQAAMNALPSSSQSAQLRTGEVSFEQPNTAIVPGAYAYATTHDEKKTGELDMEEAEDEDELSSIPVRRGHIDDGDVVHQVNRTTITLEESVVGSAMMKIENVTAGGDAGGDGGMEKDKLTIDGAEMDMDVDMIRLSVADDNDNQLLSQQAACTPIDDENVFGGQIGDEDMLQIENGDENINQDQDDDDDASVNDMETMG